MLHSLVWRTCRSSARGLLCPSSALVDAAVVVVDEVCVLCCPVSWVFGDGIAEACGNLTFSKSNLAISSAVSPVSSVPRPHGRLLSDCLILAVLEGVRCCLVVQVRISFGGEPLRVRANLLRRGSPCEFVRVATCRSPERHLFRSFVFLLLGEFFCMFWILTP